MRTETIRLYRFNELSDKAKARAVEDYCASGEPYHFDGENMASIKALAKHFGGRIKDYSIDWLGTSYSSMEFEMPEMDAEEIRQRLNQLGTFNPDTLKGHGDCKLTGYCADEAAIDGLRKSFAAGEHDLDKLMQAAFQTWLKDAQSDAEHQFSLEGYAEQAEVNNFEFTENGKRWEQ